MADEKEPVESAKPTPQELEAARINEQLKHAAPDPDPLGTGVYAAGKRICCADMTEVQAALLGGSWVAGEACPVTLPDPAASTGGTLTPLEAAVAEMQKILTVQKTTNEAIGVCVFSAGNRARRATMSKLQCDLIGGAWFPEETPTAGPPKA